jgi:hypothetical protein
MDQSALPRLPFERSQWPMIPREDIAYLLILLLLAAAIAGPLLIRRAKRRERRRASKPISLFDQPRGD